MFFFFLYDIPDKTKINTDRERPEKSHRLESETAGFDAAGAFEMSLLLNVKGRELQNGYLVYSFTQSRLRAKYMSGSLYEAHFENHPFKAGHTPQVHYL